MTNQLDNNILEKYTVWFAKLSNDEIWYEDPLNDNSFKELKSYCDTNSLWIKEFYIRFRSHTEKVFEDDNYDGFFFIKSIIGFFGSNRNSNMYNVGYVSNDVITSNKWSTPEILQTESETRKLSEYTESVIMKYDKKI